jgi:nucleoside-diphosphate-sugar epimerase
MSARRSHACSTRTTTCRASRATISRDPNNRGLADAVARVAGRPSRPWRMPWAVVPLMGLFNPTMREMAEMRPFWEHPVRLDNASLVATIGEEPHTPIDEAVRTTLSALGSL